MLHHLHQFFLHDENIHYHLKPWSRALIYHYIYPPSRKARREYPVRANQASPLLSTSVLSVFSRLLYNIMLAQHFISQRELKWLSLHHFVFNQ
jgi:hypothetical protein